MRPTAEFEKNKNPQLPRFHASTGGGGGSAAGV